MEKVVDHHLSSCLYAFVMIGLKSYLPFLSSYFDLTEAALYERQRALVRLGLLKATPGRGPGSGVRLTAEAVAALITSILMADNWSDIDGRVAKMFNAGEATDTTETTAPRKRKTFGSAFAELLSAPSAAAEVEEIVVRRTSTQAIIYFLSVKSFSFDKIGAENEPREFSAPARTSSGKHALSVEARLNGGAIRDIAATLAKQDRS